MIMIDRATMRRRLEDFRPECQTACVGLGLRMLDQVRRCGSAAGGTAHVPASARA
jgi:hypothetical protein